MNRNAKKHFKKEKKIASFKFFFILKLCQHIFNYFKVAIYILSMRNAKKKLLIQKYKYI